MPILVIVTVALFAYILYFQASSAAQVNDTGVNVRATTGSLTGAPITEDESTWPTGDKAWDIAHAIAKAEGYNRGTGFVPFDLNNPGDISDGAGEFGSQHHSGSNVTTFPDAETGWQWLHTKLSNALGGKSTVFVPSMTWTEVAKKWAGDWQNWVNNVTSELGVDPNSTLADYNA